MAEINRLIERAGLTAVAVLLVAWPAAALPQNDGRSRNNSDSYSAPEIEIALVSSAVLVAGGAALILRDRKARRKLDKSA